MFKYPASAALRRRATTYLVLDGKALNMQDMARTLKSLIRLDFVLMFTKELGSYDHNVP